MAELKIQALTGADQGVICLGLDRPAAKNALGRQLLESLRQALGPLHALGPHRVMILHSLVPGVFCAGADLKERAGMNASEVNRFVHGLRSAFRELEVLPMPTLAVIEGAALGGGLELALSCDMRILGSEAVLGLPETGLAIIPGAGGTQRLPRLIGRAKAKELIFTARRVNADEAEQLGLANAVAPAGHAMEKALDLARHMLTKGPLALRAAKQAIDGGLDMDLESGLALERACYSQIIPTKDRLEGLAAFREKRAPIYRGE